MSRVSKFMLAILLLTGISFGGDVYIVTKYGKTGGIVGAINQTTDLVNGRQICPADPTAGCDFSDDPGYNGGVLEDQTDDTYNGDLLVRTNDVFEAVAGWRWNGVAGGADEKVTITGTLPANGWYEYTDLPGDCDPAESSISADKHTIVCVRKDFDKNDAGTYAEDLKFPVRVLGGTPSGTQPGDIAFKLEDATGANVSEDNTDGNSLTVTAAPRWNLEKSMYTALAGKEYDYNGDGTPDKGWIMDYKFYIESDEVVRNGGEVDTVNPIVGNESMGDDATFEFKDVLDRMPAGSTLIDCSMHGRYTNRDGYDGSYDPITCFGAGCIRGTQFPERHILTDKDHQVITCEQPGGPDSEISIKVEHVDATLNHYPTKDYSGRDLPVNRAIAAIGNVYIFIPLASVEKGADGVAGTDDDGQYTAYNKMTGFDPTTPTGHSNFAGETESEKDNEYGRTLYSARGDWSKYYRGTQHGLNDDSGVWAYIGSGYRSGDGMVNKGSEFSTALSRSNSGGTYLEEDTTCDVIDAYRMKIQAVQDNTVYERIKHDYTGKPEWPFRFVVWSGEGNYTHADGADGIPYIVEYATGYVDGAAFLPSLGADTTVAHGDEIITECTDPNVQWTTDFAAAAAGTDAQGRAVGVTKVRWRLKPGIKMNPGSSSYFFLNHKIREKDLVTDAVMNNNDLITDFATHKFDYQNTWSKPDYKPGTFPGTHSGWGGDRVIYTGAKVRIKKLENRTGAGLGDEVIYTLQSSYTNDTGLDGTGDVKIIDVLPKAFKYKAGSAVTIHEAGKLDIEFGNPVIGTCADAIAAEANYKRACVDGENEVLIWDLGDIAINAPGIPDLNYTVQVGASANSGNNFNTTSIVSSTDASPITQRTSEIGVVINVPSSLIIVKKTVDNPDYPEQRERITDYKEIWFTMDVRSGYDASVHNVDIIDILPFKGDGNDNAMKFAGNQNQHRKINTDYHGDMYFSRAKFKAADDSPAVCDTTNVKFYYTNAVPGTIDLAPTVSTANQIGHADSVWCEGTEDGPNGCTIASSGYTFPAGEDGLKAVTAVRAKGATMEPQAICQMWADVKVRNNLKGDNYSNTSGASANEITNPVLSNSVAAPVVGSSLGDYVWYDKNKDGIQDAGETAIPNIKVHLLDGNGDPVNDPTTGQPYIVTTDANGKYLFDNLNHGDYKVKFELHDGYLVSPKGAGANNENSDATKDVGAATATTDTISLSVAEDNPNIDLGLHTPIISGHIFNDGDGDAHVNGALISQPDGTQLYATLLDASGNLLASVPIVNGEYIFNGEYIKANKDYKVILTDTDGGTIPHLPANWNNTGEQPSNGGTNNDGAADGTLRVHVDTVDVPDNDFGINLKPVAEDDNKTGGIENSPNGPIQQPVTWNVVTNDHDAEQNDTVPSTFKFESGKPGSTISADGKTITVPGEGVWTVDDQGNVTFTPEAGFIGDPTPVTYSVEDKAGVRSDPATITITYPPVRKLSGNVSIDTDNDDNGDKLPLEPVKIELFDENGTKIAETMTDANGHYSFDVIPGKYTVKETDPANTTSVKDVDSNVTGSGQPDGTNDNTINNIDVTQQDSPENNFVDEPVVGNVKGKIFKDADTNGVFDGSDSPIPDISVTIVDVYGNEHNVSTDADGNFDLTGLPVGPARLTASTTDPDLPEGAKPESGTTPVTLDIPANAYAEHNVPYIVPPLLDSDPAKLAQCAKPSSITWEGSTVSSATVWHGGDMHTPKSTMTVGDKNISVLFTLIDNNNTFNYDDSNNTTSHGGTDDNTTNKAAFGQPYLSLYLGKQDDNTTKELPAGAYATLIVDFNESVILDNWRIRDLDSGNERGGKTGWDWQDAIKMIGYDKDGNEVPLIHTQGSNTNLVTDANGFLHTDGAGHPDELTGGGTDADSPRGHVVYSSNGVPIQKIVLIHAAGPDIAAQTRSALALSGFAVCVPLHISGHVFDDGNAANVDGTLISQPDGEQLYAHLVDSTGKVIDTMEINASGEYEFHKHINKDSNYTVVLSKEQTAEGSQMPAPVLPDNWNNTNEQLNDGAAAVDGTPDGKLLVEVHDESVPNNDFGINKKPTAVDKNEPSQLNPGGDVNVTVPALEIHDLEDGTPTTITIETLPANAKLYYDGQPVVAGDAIPNYDPAKLTVDPDNGDQTVVFDYTTTDAAGVKSEPATVTLPFTQLKISGTIYEDGNGNNDGKVNASTATIYSPDGTQLYATLLDATGNVLASKPIAADGSYLFDGVDGVAPDTNFSVVLAITQNATTADLPAKWNNTGENLNANGDGNDTANDGMIVVSVAQADVPQVDFGINKKPEAGNVEEPVQLNPGQDNQVPVPDLSISDEEDGTPPTVTIQDLPANATLYYNNTPVVAGTPIENFDQSKLTIDPIDGDQNVTFHYTTTDQAGVESEQATVKMAFKNITLSGHLFDDGDGDSNVNGTAINKPDGTQLYVTLVDDQGNAVATKLLADDGSYAFQSSDGLSAHTDYAIVLSTDANGTTPKLPSTWNNTGEIKENPGTGKDAAPDGQLAVSTKGLTVANSESPDNDLGINKKPEAIDVAEPVQLNPGGNTTVPVPTLKSNDKEDGDDQTPKKVKITELPTNAKLYYEGNLIAAGDTIDNYDPAKLTVDPDDGDQDVTFKYTVFDNDGVESDPATVTMPFKEITLSGHLFDDGDGDGNVDGAAINKPNGTQLYVTLVDDQGNAVATKPLADDGSYSFTTVDGLKKEGDYTIVLSTDANGTTPKLPSSWNNTGEVKENPGTGKDAAPDGQLTVSTKGLTVLNNESADNDLGINNKPVANDKTEKTQSNPSGNKQYPVPTLPVTDTEDGTPATITIKTLPDPATGVLYYDGQPVTAGQVIPNFDPSKLTVDPTEGNQVMVFTYTTTDAAGVESDPATVTMPFLGEMHLGDTVWMDDNGDGVQDSGEKGVAGVKVTLLDEKGNVVDTVTTDSNGKYEFIIKKPGNYRVAFDDSYYYTKKCATCTEDKDSNVQGLNNTTDLIKMDWGDSDMTIDAGITPTAHIGDYFWIDVDKNGMQDANEDPVVNALVELLDEDGNPVLDQDGNPIVAHTDKNGKYGFDVPAGKKYLVRFTIPQKYIDDGYVFTGSNAGADGKDSDVSDSGVITVPVHAKAGSNYLTLDAGINCGCDGVESDSSDAMGGIMGMLMLIFSLGMGLLMIRREEAVA